MTSEGSNNALQALLRQLHQTLPAHDAQYTHAAAIRGPERERESRRVASIEYQRRLLLIPT